MLFCGVINTLQNYVNISNIFAHYLSLVWRLVVNIVYSSWRECGLLGHISFCLFSLCKMIRK